MQLGSRSLHLAYYRASEGFDKVPTCVPMEPMAGEKYSDAKKGLIPPANLRSKSSYSWDCHIFIDF